MLRLMLALGLLLLASAGWAQSLGLDTVNGGGSRSFASGLILSGAIGNVGLGNTTQAGLSKSSSNRVYVGFYAAWEGIRLKNSADPIWIEISQLCGELPETREARLYQPRGSWQLAMSRNFEESRWIP